MNVSSTDIVNEALQLIGDDGPPVTGVAPNFNSSTAGKNTCAKEGEKLMLKTFAIVLTLLAFQGAQACGIFETCKPAIHPAKRAKPKHRVIRPPVERQQIGIGPSGEPLVIKEHSN